MVWTIIIDHIISVLAPIKFYPSTGAFKISIFCNISFKFRSPLNQIVLYVNSNYTAYEVNKSHNFHPREARFIEKALTVRKNDVF